MTDRRALEEELDRAIRRLAPRAERLSDALAARPEVSGEERYASSRHRRFLRSRGFLVRPGAAGLPWAYEARAEGPPGGSVAFAAEMDALPDLGHACGHNLGGALSLLAGAALAELLPRIGGSVTVWGTPEEERGGGKARMAEAGLFDGHHLLASVHPSASESFLRPRTLACAAFLGTFRGDRGGRLFLHATDLLRRTLPPEVRLQVRPRGPDAEGVVWAPRRELLRLALDRLRRGELVPVPQDHDRATLAPMLTKEKGHLDWHRPATELHCLIRGLDPWPSAYTFLDGRRLRLFRPEVVPTSADLAPGTIRCADSTGLLVATGADSLRLREVQPEGRKRMPVSACLNGLPLPAGARLS